jgi:hypothetical protein
MDVKDYVGMRGEIVFPMLITRWCNGEPWFSVVFLGEKAEAKDFLVNLIEPTSGDASFYVQVKATTQGYSGKGANRKLKVKVEAADVEKLKLVPAPAFVVGIDVHQDCGFLLAITGKTKTAAISGLLTTHRLNCHLIKKLWKEVDEYWKQKKMLPTSSLFS